MRLGATFRILRLFFIDRGLDALRAMIADRWVAKPKKFAHVREELILGG
jgi:hypothetical protein